MRLNELGQDDLAYDRAESAAIKVTAVAKFGSICGDGAFGSRFHEKTTNDNGVRRDKSLYRQRNRVERCFNRLKQFRRIATRY